MLIELLHEDNHCLKRTDSDEYHGACPWCGGDDRFMIWESRNKYYCRQCDRKGDAIQYLRDFRKLSYHEAADVTGNQTPAKQNKVIPWFKAKPGEGWRVNADRLISTASSFLAADSSSQAELFASRGITLETARRFNLGWLPHDIYDDRANWGLPEKFDENGKAKKLFIPAGLLIPGPDRLRVRQAEKRNGRKYYLVPGSGSEPMIINGHLNTDVAAAIVIESELDGILLAQELRNEFVFIATGSTANGPSVELIDSLTRRSFVWIALDSDTAGAKAAWEKWMGLKNAIRTPIPASWGKDHTEAHQNGYDLNLWMEAAYEIVMGANTEASVCIKTKTG